MISSCPGVTTCLLNPCFVYARATSSLRMSELGSPVQHCACGSYESCGGMFPVVLYTVKLQHLGNCNCGMGCVCHLTLNAGTLQHHAHQGQQQRWHKIFVAPFRESVKGLTFFKHVAAHGLCSTCKMDHIIITVQLKALVRTAPTSSSNTSRTYLPFVCAHMSGNWARSMCFSRVEWTLVSSLTLAVASFWTDRALRD